MVYNHFGPSDLDLWTFDGWQENGKGGIYFYNDDRSRWGDTRPDMAVTRSNFIVDNALMWLRDYRVDGLVPMHMVPHMYTHQGNYLNEGWTLMRRSPMRCAVSSRAGSPSPRTCTRTR